MEWKWKTLRLIDEDDIDTRVVNVDCPCGKTVALFLNGGEGDGSGCPCGRYFSLGTKTWVVAMKDLA